MIDLEPCPFCGGEAEYEENDDPKYAGFGFRWISCKECNASSVCMIPLKDAVDEALAEAWNSRAVVEPQSEQDAINEVEDWIGGNVTSEGFDAMGLTRLLRAKFAAVRADERECAARIAADCPSWNRAMHFGTGYCCGQTIAAAIRKEGS